MSKHPAEKRMARQLLHARVALIWRMLAHAVLGHVARLNPKWVFVQVMRVCLAVLLPACLWGFWAVWVFAGVTPDGCTHFEDAHVTHLGTCAAEVVFVAVHAIVTLLGLTELVVLWAHEPKFKDGGDR